MSTEMTTVNPDGQLPVKVQEKDAGLMVQWDQSANAVATSLDTNGQGGKMDYIRCLTTPAKLAKHQVGAELSIRDWVLHEVELPGKVEGEIVPALRLVFVLANNELVSTTSIVLIDNWRHVVKMFGGQTFNPPLKMKISAVKSRKIGEYLQIASIECDRAVETTARKGKTSGTV